MDSIYLDGFPNRQSVLDCFGISEEEVADAHIWFAWYGYEDYHGSAFVLFEKDETLYEVHGGHCSCDGLNGQWEPHITSVEHLQYRLANGGVIAGMCDEQLKTLLAETLSPRFQSAW